MNAISATVICAGTAILCSCLKRRWPEIALATAIAAGICVLAAIVPQIKEITEKLEDAIKFTGTDAGALSLMLKACGISLVAEFGAQICKDAGESALAGRIQLCARLAILAMAAPLIADILLQLSSLLSP